MKKNRALHVAAFLVVGVFVLNLLATYLHLYWVFSWFDMLMHFLGGVAAGYLVYIILYKKASSLQQDSPVLFIFLIVGGTLVIGFLWEILEVVLDTFFRSQLAPALSDSLSDLFFDALGGMVAGLWVFRKS